MKIYLGIYNPTENKMVVSDVDTDPAIYGLPADAAKEDYDDLSGAVYGVECIRPGLVVIWAFASREAVVAEFYEQFFYMENLKDVSIIFAEKQQTTETPIQDR